jgi:hypothetical protein
VVNSSDATARTSSLSRQNIFMRKVIVLLIVLPFFAFRCDKASGKKCFKGKVVRISCASYVIGVLNDDSIGDDQWKDSAANGENVYDNVFSVSNKCKIPDAYKAGDIIYFNLEKPGPSDCVICMMYDAPPKTQFQIKNVSSTSCE